MTLDGLMFKNYILSPIIDGIVTAFAYVRPCIFDVVIMSVVVKWDVFEVIDHGHMKKLMVLCEL